MPDATSPAAPLRNTRQRRALMAELSATDGFRTAQELHAALREQGESVGLATVYRSLQALVEAGEVDTVKADGGESAFRLCSSQHHHHLVCRQCGRTVEITGPAVERWAAKVAEDHGYVDVNHTLELFGLCPECRASQ
ncbi:MAG TPA: Fur family transcriptional regulator [Nocardioides sp.]|uniref:Fur family transcriptional regulator n=1 Tax=Nocardioides sp. TaxID=35761 RepID=UPI002CE6F3D4|nr:Fur family transcriptional regulator [Nocardioides sp.]HTW16615.1 Fur family transcriptional regulator [Nocardioides sp.]